MLFAFAWNPQMELELYGGCLKKNSKIAFKCSKNTK
jgi:hypothetical protein